MTPRFYGYANRAKQWRIYLERNKLSGTPSDFAAVGDRLLSFLSEPWGAMVRESEFTGNWSAGGPWRHG